MPEQRYQTVLLFGPPGSGKGTQGKIFASIPGFFHFSCGDVFRRLDINSRLGKVFLEFSSHGKLVPDDVVVEMWQKHIFAQEILGAYKPDSDILVLDGIPRTVNQTELMRGEMDVRCVIHLVCPDEGKMIERLRRRALKENRFDDAKESIIRHRWEVYRAETAPVLGVYPKEIVKEINAQASPVEVLREILDILIPVQYAHWARMSAGDDSGS
ncbi:MAG TPA: nucleoside monophosphate kinase [Planctomycetia bacterium]|nr:nucleoside monophosphate kinase [Planctomycetia bacterium]